MIRYLFQRLLLFPITIFTILTINFIIINLAPNEPNHISQSGLGDTQSSDNQNSGQNIDPYATLRKFYGLNLPIFLNTWMWQSNEDIYKSIKEWIDLYQNDLSTQGVKKLRQMRDRASYQMPQLLELLQSSTTKGIEKKLISELMVFGARRIASTKLYLSAAKRRENEDISQDNARTSQWIITDESHSNAISDNWQIYLSQRPDLTRYAKSSLIEKVTYSITETRFIQYLYKVARLDFGFLQQDHNKTVVYEVLRRIPTSIILAFIPMIFTLALSIFFGFIMAFWHGSILDWGLNIAFLILYSIPIFVVGPYLIEHCSHKEFLGVTLIGDGLHSHLDVYNHLNSFERLGDIIRHAILPIIAVTYGTWASKSRLLRNSILEIIHSDYVIAARSRGIPSSILWIQYILRAASIPLITALAGSLNIILGGSLIIETLFEIDGFGKFFYEAIIARDINVMMFSTLMGSVLTLIGYLIMDISYLYIDPRIQFSSLKNSE